MRTYRIVTDSLAYLPLPSNATIIDQEQDDENHTAIFVKVESNFTRFEQQLDTNANVVSYEVVEVQ